LALAPRSTAPPARRDGRTGPTLHSAPARVFPHTAGRTSVWIFIPATFSCSRRPRRGAGAPDLGPESGPDLWRESAPRRADAPPSGAHPGRRLAATGGSHQHAVPAAPVRLPLG